VLPRLSRTMSLANQLYALVTYAEQHHFVVASVVTGDIRAAINAVQVGTADMVLTDKPDCAGALLRSPVPVVYVHPPAVLMTRPAGPPGGRTVGLLVLEALRRLDGDVATVALAFDLPLDLVAEADAERRGS
jgi:hypothetical protein